MSGGKSSPDPYYEAAAPKKKTKQQGNPSELPTNPEGSGKVIPKKEKKHRLDPSELPVKPLGPVKVILMPKTKKKPPITGRGFTGLNWYKCDHCGEIFLKRKKVQGKSALCSPECISGWNSKWRKGLPKSEEHRKKIGDAHRGRSLPEGQKKKLSDTRKKLYKDPDFRARQQQARDSPEAREKQAASKRGPRNPNWKGGPSARKRGRSKADTHRESAYWREKSKQVQQRDNNECQGCDEKTGKGLDVHHQYPLNKWIQEGNDPIEYPDEWLVTLCKSCHRKAEAQPGIFKPPL